MDSAPVHPLSTWRLITTPPARGAWNMAVDEAILEAIGQSNSLPVLRLYAWDPPCLSLGYAQPAADVDMQRLAVRGWELVRRPTGGRAILHTDELTYSVIGPPDEPRLKGDVLQSYQRLSKALLSALIRLGLRATAHPLSAPAQTGGSKGPVCFEVPSNYEITVEGKKLVGSAQARKREGVLQHGTLPLWGDLSRITQALCFEREGKREEAVARLLSRAITVESALGRRISWDEAAQAFADAFEDELALRLLPSKLTPQESRRAEELVRDKYANQEWTMRQ